MYDTILPACMDIVVFDLRLLEMGGIIFERQASPPLSPTFTQSRTSSLHKDLLLSALKSYTLSLRHILPSAREPRSFGPDLHQPSPWWIFIFFPFAFVLALPLLLCCCGF